MNSILIRGLKAHVAITNIEMKLISTGYRLHRKLSYCHNYKLPRAAIFRDSVRPLIVMEAACITDPRMADATR